MPGFTLLKIMTKEEILKEYYNTWFYCERRYGTYCKYQPYDKEGYIGLNDIVEVSKDEIDDNVLFVSTPESSYNPFAVWELTENATKEDFDD